MKNKVAKCRWTPGLQKGSQVELGKKENHEPSVGWGRKRKTGEVEGK